MPWRKRDVRLPTIDGDGEARQRADVGRDRNGLEQLEQPLDPHGCV